MNWATLIDEDLNGYWDYIYDVLAFAPYAPRPIRPPKGSLIFSTKPFLGDGYSQELIDDLNEKTRAILQTFDEMIALDWQHGGYAFDSFLPFELDEFDEWYVPAFPNGDHTFFLTKDMQNGIYGDEINFTITYFGRDMIKAFYQHNPKMFMDVSPN